MPYRVKELFYTLQGEGANTGRAAVFCRFAGCNLWSGREEDRATAICRFCDTDFVGTNASGGGIFVTARELAKAVMSQWGGVSCSRIRPLVVCTGGEPLLQLDTPLIAELHRAGFEIAVETNGTIIPPPEIDWLCVSPKATAKLRVLQGDELKLVYPQAEAPPERFEGLDFKEFFLQPMDGQQQRENMMAAAQYCLQHPQWRVSLQTHKILEIN